MDSDRLNRWMTLGANIGVLAGIIFLAFELQQNTVATQLEAASNFQDSFSEIELFIAGSPEFAELLRKGRVGLLRKRSTPMAIHSFPVLV